MRYVSIDIETTGLNPERDQILEFGAVIGDTEKEYNINNAIKFHKIILHRRIVGDVFAINMNREIIQEIKEAYDKSELNRAFCSIQYLEENFIEWLVKNDFDIKEKINVAGKNFVGFDQKFLEPYFKNIKFSQRVLDPAVLYFDKEEDYRLPDLQTCKQRAGLNGNVSHRALGDALDVVLLLQKKLNND